MSIDALKWARHADVQKSSSKLVLMMLAQHVRYDSDDWLVFASIEYLAAVTHLNRKTVIDALARLRELGAIVDTGRKAGNNRSCTVYRLCPQNVPSIGTAAEQRMASNAWQPELIPQPAPVQPAPAELGGDNIPAPDDMGNGVPLAEDDGKPTAGETTDRNLDMRYKPAQPPTTPGMAGSGPSPLPNDWALPESWLAWTQGMRPHWSQEKIETVAAMFKSYWRSKAGTAALSTDWYESWRLWVFREREPTNLQDPKAWSKSWTGIQQMGKKLGLEQHPHEPAQHFRSRVHEAAGVPLVPL